MTCTTLTKPIHPSMDPAQESQPQECESLRFFYERSIKAAMVSSPSDARTQLEWCAATQGHILRLLDTVESLKFEDTERLQSEFITRSYDQLSEFIRDAGLAVDELCTRLTNTIDDLERAEYLASNRPPIAVGADGVRSDD